MHVRYRIENIIGEGGMGTIARAYDRLTNTWVALKQLSLETNGDEMTTTEGESTRFALAEEFRLLATLRHPHIVSVLDYGFALNAAPNSAFFTMEYLAEAQPFTQAAQAQPLAGRLQLLGQLLQALEYVRRHQVMHRDLKPDNVLVQADQVKVLDFGLAVFEGQASTTMGSLFYMAPETFQSQPITHTTDLFAVGVMAYEVLAGQRPFVARSLEKLAQQICHTEPDYTQLAGPVALRAVVARLLAKNPAARFATAAEALSALATASGERLPLETQATRASLIQAAQFVGRGEELAQLTRALAHAQQGQGSVWLLGGESGVGKSRLLEELRIRALVRHTWVWHGQAVSEGGQAVELWRNVLLWLALAAQLSDLEASVLKPFVPQVEELLQQAVAEAPALEAQAAQDRFCAVVLALLRRVTAQQPLVLILEDLHWAGPLSRTLLAWVSRVVSELPLLIVATYRDDEQPQLPQELPLAHCLALKRLAAPHIEVLTSAILGQPADHLQHLTQFLYQQTEGNALFVVEVLRSLAEEAGLLSQVQAMALPEHLLVGGMQAVIQRRLHRIAPHDYPWLELAAVAGRELDIQLLHYLDNVFDWAAWLSRCAEAAVLEPQGAAWRFTHDQVRQALLSALPAARSTALHETIAVALEQVYAADLAPHLSHLVHHYTHARHAEKLSHYLWLAGRMAQGMHDYARALACYSHLLGLAVDESLQTELHLRHGAVLEMLGRWAEAEAAYQAALAQSVERQDVWVMAYSQKALGVLARRRGDYATALTYLAAAQQGAEASADQAALAEIQAEIGIVYEYRSAYPTAQRHLDLALDLARAQHDPYTTAMILGRLGKVYVRQGVYALAQPLLEESLAMRQQMGDKPGVATALHDLATIKSFQKDYAAAQELGQASLALRRELGDKEGIATTLTNLGYYAGEVGDYAQAHARLVEGLALCRELESNPMVAAALQVLGVVMYWQGADYGAAMRHLAEAVILSQTMGNNLFIMWGLVSLAACYAAVGQSAKAVTLAAAAEDLRQALQADWGNHQPYNAALAAGQATLSAVEFEEAWAKGMAMSLETAIAYAVALG